MATITLDNLNKDTQLKTVPKYEDSILSSGNSIIQNALASIQSTQDTVNEAMKTNNDSLTKISTLNKDLLGKADYTAEARKNAGVDTELANLDKYGQELNTINANITGLNREAQAIPLQIQEQFKNTGATDTGVAPIQAGELRKNAIKALTQASLADIAVANIKNTKIRYDTALEKANQAVDLKYEPIEKEIAQLKEQLQLNKEYILDPAEKKLIAEQTKVLNERERIMNEDKEKEKEMNNLKIEVAKAGGNPSSLDKATSISDAINMASSSLKTPNTEVVKMNENLAYVVDKNTGKVISTLGSSGTGTGGTGSTTIASNYLQQKRNLSYDLIDELIPETTWKTVGFGGLSGFIPSSPAKDYSAKLLTLKSQIGFGELQAMRDASKTGGALGNVANQELEALQNSLGALDTLQSPKQMKEELKKIQGIINRWNNAVTINQSKKDASPILGLSDKQAVEYALNRAGKKYDVFINNTPKGQIPVVLRSTGKAGYVPIQEYLDNPTLYIKS